MPEMQNVLGHLRTINEHKLRVMKNCFRIGLYKQGLLHDLTKYMPCELLTGFKYYRGFKSPNIVEREDKGYSSAWMHHKGRNRHHVEYWTDYTVDRNSGPVPVEMPLKYACEMICDKIAASKTYNKEKYTDSAPLDYFLTSEERYFMHPNTKLFVTAILTMLSKKGEDYTFAYMRKILRQSKKYAPLPMPRIAKDISARIRRGR